MGKKKTKSIHSPQYEYIVLKLRQARREAGLKQQVVADKLGKYESYLSKIENGDRRVDILELVELATVYKKDLNFFVPPV
jgi:transcriptional regulator with XRE-family HTH domain